MFSLSTLAKNWNRFFYSEIDATFLCIYRIFLGVVLFLNGVTLVPDLNAWFGVDHTSLVPLGLSQKMYTDYRINLFSVMAPTLASAWFILLGYIVTSFTFMIGFKTRFSAVLCFIFLCSLQNRNYVILNSGDTVMRCMLFVMMFAPSYVKFSLDAYFQNKQGTPYKTIVPLVTIRMLQIQFSIIYLATTFFKLKGLDWVNGTAVYYTSRLESFQRVVLPVVFDHIALIKFSTWSALFIEFAMGSLIWIKELRIPVLIAGILLHIGIEVTMSIGFFEWIMMAGYLIYLTPRDIKVLRSWMVRIKSGLQLKKPQRIS